MKRKLGSQELQLKKIQNNIEFIIIDDYYV